MSLQIEYKHLDALAPYDRNPRSHTPEQIRSIERSLARFGWTAPMATADGVLIYGHARRQAAINLRNRGVGIPQNDDPTCGPVVDLSHLSADERRAYVIADNQLAALAGWDESLLVGELQALDLLNFDMAVIGFEPDELKLLLTPLGTEEEAEPDTRGGLLALADITRAEPKHPVEAGEHWLLEARHHLFCVSVIEDWPAWHKFLRKGTLFVPYPGPFVTYAVRAAEAALVLVQPDPYAAGVLLDRVAEGRGEQALERMRT